MINTFQIWAHPLTTIEPGRQKSPTFQTANTLFHVENRVTNLRDAALANPNGILATVVRGGLGGIEAQNQNVALRPAMWLPSFRNSEGLTEIVQLQPYERMQFTYDSVDAVNTFTNIQTAFLGHNDYPGEFQIELVQPYTYATKPVTVPANGTMSANIFINPFGTDPMSTLDYGMLVKAFVGIFPNHSMVCTIRDMGSQYQLMNIPILMDNFVYNFNDENNFAPKPFSPWIAPQRHQYEVTFGNLTNEPLSAQIGFFGNLCKFSHKL